jgi:hypothetical protein
VRADQGTREPLAPARDALVDTATITRHRADRRDSAPGPLPNPRLTAIALVPAAAVAVVAALTVFVLLHGGRLADPLGVRSVTALCALGVLLLAVMLGGVAWARSVGARAVAAAASAAEPTVVYLPAEPLPAAETLAGLVAPTQVPAADNGVFVHLSQRLQSLVHRQIELLDGLENEVEEPDLLKGLFNVDHLATRMRRHAENLAVLGGNVPRRQWTRPVSMMEVLRSAVSETLDYARVQVIARSPEFLNGYAVADVIHLLAELVENATSFSPPGTKVVLRASPVTAGLAVEIDDRGLGMDQQEYDRLNALLREPDGISVRELLEGARIGLYVVAQLARRHQIAIRLQSNITGGTQALVVLPRALLASADPRSFDQPRDDRAPAPGPAPAPVAETARVERIAYGIDGALPSPRRPGDAAPISVSTGAPRAVQAPPIVPAPRPQPTADAVERPPLPRRRPQENLAAPLLEAAPDPASRVGEEPSPTLLADFRRGLARGSEAPAAAPTDYEPSQEGER